MKVLIILLVLAVVAVAVLGVVYMQLSKPKKGKKPQPIPDPTPHPIPHPTPTPMPSPDVKWVTVPKGKLPKTVINETDVGGASNVSLQKCKDLMDQNPKWTHFLYDYKGFCTFYQLEDKNKKNLCQELSSKTFVDWIDHDQLYYRHDICD